TPASSASGLPCRSLPTSNQYRWRNVNRSVRFRATTSGGETSDESDATDDSAASQRWSADVNASLPHASTGPPTPTGVDVTLQAVRSLSTSSEADCSGSSRALSRGLKSAVA